MEFLGKISAWLMATLTPFGSFGLLVLAVCDSSFLSLPEVNDALLMAFSIKNPDRMLEFATFTTIGSVIGCLLLYAVGRKGGEALLKRRFAEQRVARVKGWYQRFGMLAVIVPSLLPPPLPFKIFVLSAGAFHLSWPRFVAAVCIGRGIRYYTEGILAVVYGKQAIQFVAEHAAKFGIALAFLIVAGAMIFVHARSRGRSARAAVIPFLLVFLLGAGCLKKTTNVPRDKLMLPAFPMSRTEAIRRLEQISRDSRDIQNISTKVTVQATIGGVRTMARSESKTLDGTLVLQRPSHIRLRAKVLLAIAFDLVSNGEKYQFLIPEYKQLWEGMEDGPPIGSISKDPMINTFVTLRPKQVQDAVFINVLPLLENPDIGMTVENLPVRQDRKYYYVVMFTTGSATRSRIVEKIWFDLSSPKQEVARRQAFKDDGEVETDVRYSGWQLARGSDTAIPSNVQIEFPDRETVLTITVDPQSATLNGKLSESAFELDPGDAIVKPLPTKDVASTP
jgi:membrane protein YqaA with SNARE-associated domain